MQNMIGWFRLNPRLQATTAVAGLKGRRGASPMTLAIRDRLSYGGPYEGQLHCCAEEVR